LLVRHNAGGGTEHHVRDVAVRLAREGVRPILVRPAWSGGLIWEERAPSGEVTWCRLSMSDRSSLQELLDLIKPVHAHVHHLLGVPDALIELFRDRKLQYDWTIHDYHAICPRIHLIGDQGVYCQEPEPAACNACLSRLGDDCGRPVNDTITAWRERFGRHLIGARQVLAPSEDAARRIRRYMRGLQMTIRPHPEELQCPGPLACRLVPGERVRVAVLGTIVAAKGSERLLECARDAKARRLPLEFQVVGTTDRNAQFRAIANVHISGWYRAREVFDRLAAARCHLAFLPTVCPESFMYTLSIVVAAGFYTVCFDLGAQAERLRAWGWGEVLSLDAPVQAVNDSLLAGAVRLAKEGRLAPRPPRPADYADLLKSYYGFSPIELEEMGIGPSLRLPSPDSERNAHARLHKRDGQLSAEGRCAGSFGQARPSRGDLPRRAVGRDAGMPADHNGGV
jgi:hypothetical protein